MSLVAILAGTGLAAGHLLHVATAAVTWWRQARAPVRAIDAGLANGYPPVSVIVPVTLVDEHAEQTLASLFALAYPAYELIFCAPRAADPAVELVNALMKTHRSVNARLLTGRSIHSVNPKLDNMGKGWQAARHPWILIVDDNIIVPQDFIQQMLSLTAVDVGLVSAAPLGCRSQSFWADVECAFLNTYQARMLLTADALGAGFAHGKAMLFQRSLLSAQGGLDDLACDVAEDSAATKRVRDQGLHVRLLDRPLPQPLGRRSLRQVWHRQLRWAQLRRSSFPRIYLTEPLSTSLAPTLMAAVLAAQLGVPVSLAVAGSLTAWLATELALARASGWPLRATYVPACIVRDIVITLIWPLALLRNQYSWRGNAIRMSERHARSLDGSAPRSSLDEEQQLHQ